MKPLSAALLAVGIAAAALFAGIGRPDEARSVAAPDSTKGITTSGAGTVESVPDHAAFSFGVESQGDTAREALAANGDRMRRLVAALREAGVDARDIRTQAVYLNSRYSNEGQTVVGYTATNTVGAEIDELAKAGDIVDAAVSAGANQVSGPSLSREDRAGLERDALRKAVADARAKAEALADAAGVSLGRAISVVEGASADPPIPYYERSTLAADSATPIQPGTEKIEATVTVTFALS
jgi:uncharacterized protein